MKPIKKELINTSLSLKIANTPGVEPEAQAAVREVRAQAPAGYQQSGSGGAGQQLGHIPIVGQYATTAGEIANAARTACAACKHFDRKAFVTFVQNSLGPAASAEAKQTIQTMRSRIAMAGYGYRDSKDEVDVEATLMAHGICRPLSDWVEGQSGRDPFWWPVVVWREATCPSYVKARNIELPVVTADKPYGFYVPKDLDAEKIGAKRYDQVMRDAQGRKP